MWLHATSDNICNVGVECWTAESESGMTEDTAEREDAAEQYRRWLEAPIKCRMAKYLTRDGTTPLTNKRDDKADEPDRTPEQTTEKQHQWRKKTATSIAETADHKDEPSDDEDNDRNLEQA